MSTNGIKSDIIKFRVEPELHQSLIRWAAEEGRSEANLLRRLISLQVERHERKRAAKAEAAA